MAFLCLKIGGDILKELKFIFKFMESNKFIYFLSILSIFMATFFTIIIPILIKITIDSIIGDKPIDLEQAAKLIDFLGGKVFLKNNLWIIGIIIIILTILRGVFLYLKNTLSSRSAENTVKNIREELYDHIQKLPYEYHVKLETGELLQRCTSDIEIIRRFLAVQFTEIGGVLFMLIFVLYVMFNMHIKMTLISMSLLPVIFIFAYVFFSRVQKVFEASEEAEAKMSIVLQENLTGIRVVKAFSRQNYEIKKFDEKNNQYKDLTYNLMKLFSWYWSISDLLCMSQNGVVLVVGSLWAIKNYISLGDLIVFTAYENMLLWPIRQMGRIFSDMGKTIVSIKRIQEILNEPIERLEENYEKPKIEGNIVFENVYFEYELGKPILNEISFKIDKGMTVAILGPTGSGKSSIIYLLARLYDYQRGSIKIEGVELKNIDKKWIRKNVGIVLQEPFLFAKTIKENIKLSNPKIEDRKIYEAARIASIHEDITSFERGYDTLVGERGVSLSGGQKQRIAIARTIINECPIVVFDDSLSAVDAKTDVSIRKALNEKKNKSTTIIISHRISTISEADLILVLDKGKISQKGTHEQLIEEEGLYKRVYTIQNSIEDHFCENKIMQE